MKDKPPLVSNDKTVSLSIPDEINTLSIPEAARFYVEKLGMAVIPLHPITSAAVESPGKQPMIRDYRQKTAADMTQAYLSKWFPERTDHNLAGVILPGMVWVDFDAKKDEGAAADTWLEEHPEFEGYPRVKTKHGFHVPVVVSDLPPGAKKLAEEISDKLTIEVLTPTRPVTLAPSLRIDGQPYRWEQTGDIPTIKWQDLLKKLGVKEKKPGRPKKPRAFTEKYLGDLKTLDLKKLLDEKGILGSCKDEHEAKYAIRCPWEQEHSEQHQDIQSDTVVWCNAGALPGFRCLHAHCEERTVEHLLEWLEGQEPGIVDRFCAERRAYSNTEAADKDNKPLILHPSPGRLVSRVAEELAAAIAPKYQRGPPQRDYCGNYTQPQDEPPRVPTSLTRSSLRSVGAICDTRGLTDR